MTFFSTGEAAALLFGLFLLLIVLRVPVSFALGLACVPIFFFEPRLYPTLLLQEMRRSYDSFVLLAVPFFLLAANLMNTAGITERLMALARTMVGHLPGGLAHVNVMVSMLFAGISGSSTADAAGIGSLMIPQMKKQGYGPRFSVAITACSSVMGVIIPPSILMVVWGGIMGVSIGGLFLAGVLPGILIAGSMMGMVLIYARIYGYPVYVRATFVGFLKAFATAVLALMTPVIIVGGIVGGLFTPTEASVIAALYAMILGLVIYRTLAVTDLPRIFYDTGRFASISLFAIGTASAFGWLLAFYRVPMLLVAWVETLGLDWIGTGLMCAFLFLLIGMFIDAIPAIIIAGTVLWPVAEAAGIHPIHFAMIGIISLAFGLVTPPYGLCLLITAAIAEIKVVHALKDVGFVLLPMMAILLTVILLPDLILFLPRWLMPQFIN
jgi:tripartite ATP-independent transporter DctM subunit